MLRKLVEIQYQRNDLDCTAERFGPRRRGWRSFPPTTTAPVRVELFGDEVESIVQLDP